MKSFHVSFYTTAIVSGNPKPLASGKNKKKAFMFRLVDEALVDWPAMGYAIVRGAYCDEPVAL
jgi:hypothetical protein